MGSVRVGTGQLPLALGEPKSGLPVLDTREQRGARFLKLSVRQVLNSPATTRMPFWSINPYVGCEFGCSYCYARKTHEWAMERAGIDRGTESAHESFEHQILVKDDAPEVLLRTLEPGRLGTTTLLIGTATDPYQPAERKFLLTRRLLEALLLHRGLHISITTKSPLIARDIDLLKTLSARHDLRHSGIESGVMIAPILPGITDSWEGLAALMEAAREAGACWAVGGALRLGPSARNGFLPVLRKEFPELVARYEARYGRSQSAGKDYERALKRRIRTLQQAFGFSEYNMGRTVSTPHAPG
jgi:DNA repair photolyase